MEMIPVDSSIIAEVGYDLKTMTLEVAFNSGKVYGYRGVPLEAYKGLMAAESKGTYMRDFIIDVYPDYLISKHRR